MRWPGILYRMEAHRLREVEIALAKRSVRLLLTTEAEVNLVASFAPSGNVRCFLNGVDADFFDPSEYMPSEKSYPSRFVALVGTMDYYPNIEAACWFARHVHPRLQKLEPSVGFVIVGRNPSPAVLRLGGIPGVTVTGTVPDVRPYLAGALAVIAPFHIARGMQNKVLEALMM